MKKNIIYIVICGLCAFVSSCTKFDDFVPESFEKILSLKEFDEQNTPLYKIGEDWVYNYLVYKGGDNPNATAHATVRAWTEKELDDYSLFVGKAYKLLPDTLFQVLDTSLNFSSADKYLEGRVSLKTNEIEQLLHDDAISNYVLPLLLSSTTDSVNSKQNLVLLKPNIVIPSVDYVDNSDPLQSVIDSTAIVPVNAVGGVYKFQLVLPFVSPWDFDCTIGVDESLVPDGYLLIPSDKYELNNSGIVSFKKGKTYSDTLNVNIKNTDFIGSKYVIPLKVTQISLPGFMLPKTSFKLFGEFNRIPLTAQMLSTNAQEPREGPIENILDNNPNTYFQSAWSVTVSTVHYIQIKLKDPITRFRFYYQNRSTSNGKCRKMLVSVSNDNENWTDVVTLNNLPITQGSKYTSEIYNAGESFEYIRFSSLQNDVSLTSRYFAIAEFTLWGN